MQQEYVFKRSSTSQSIKVIIEDSRETDNSGLPGLAFDTASLVAYYLGEGVAAPVTLVLATKATIGTWVTRGFKEIEATKLPGYYELDLPDVILALAGKYVDLILQGAANMKETRIRIHLVEVNDQDPVRMGLSAMPGLNAGAIGGLTTKIA